MNRFSCQGAFDSVVVINDFERAEVKFTNMIGGERIFSAALAALQRPHETFVLFHKFKSLRTNKTASSHAEKRPKILRALLIFPRSYRGWNWHLVTSHA